MGIFGSKTFRHGIHPPESKDETRGLPIRQFPFAPVLVVPLSQHIGKPAVPVVREGQEVTRGQCVAEPDGFSESCHERTEDQIVDQFHTGGHTSIRQIEQMLAEHFQIFFCSNIGELIA